MIRLKHLTSIAALVALAACTTLGQTTSLTSRLKASEYNDVAADYLERPTFVSLQTYSNGNTALVVEMDEYGPGFDAATGTATEGLYSLRFDAKEVANYVAVIDKYFEWEKLALERGDMIDRKIGSTRAVNVNGDFDIEFSVFSGTATKHNLVAELCRFGTCSIELHFDRSNAEILRTLLIDFGNGKVSHLDVDGIYR